MTDSASFEFLEVNDNNLVKISIKIYVRLNERKLRIIFAGLGGRRWLYFYFVASIPEKYDQVCSPLTLIYIGKSPECSCLSARKTDLKTVPDQIAGAAS